MQKKTKKPSPLSLRLSNQEKAELAEAAQKLGCSRNALIRYAAVGVVQELRQTLAV